MKVAVLSKSNARGGGAGRVAQDLATGLARRGDEVFHLLADPDARADHEHLAYGRVSRMLRAQQADFGFNEYLPVEAPQVLARLRRLRPQLVHFHDLTDSFSIHTVELVSRLFPTVWTLHDQSPFTGGCLAPLDCARFAQGCGACPRLGNWALRGRVDRTKEVRRAKAALLESGRVVAVAPSHGLIADARRAGALSPGVEVEVIHNAIDAEAFPLVSRDRARRLLGIDARRPVLLLVASRLDDVIKMPAAFIEVLVREMSNPRGVLLLLVGHTPEALLSRFPPGAVRSLGFVRDPAAKAVAYAAADVFVNPSLADSFSLTSLEALGQGVRVAAFETGGIPDVVGSEPGAGWLLSPGDHGKLVETALREVHAPDPGRGARAEATRARFSMSKFVEAHQALYGRVLGGAHGAR